MYNILDILLGTPWWVYLIFIYLLVIGIKALKPNIVRWQKLIIMPAVFFLWSIYSIYKKYTFSNSIIILWFLILVFGILLGWHMAKKGIEVDKKTKLVHLSGSWFPLIFSMLFFLVKYLVGVILAIKPEMNSFAPIWFTDITATALITGISWARFLHILQKFRSY